MAWSNLPNLFRGSSHDFCQLYYNIKQIDFIFLCFFTVIDHRWRHSGWRTKSHALDCVSCVLFCSSHAMTSSVIYYSTDARKNEIYLLNNIAFVNPERWMAKSRVDITLCQHGKFPATLLLKFFVLYYKRNIKHFFRIDIQLYQHSWKLEKLEIVWKHSALRASCFHTISRFSNFHSCWYNCISTRKMFYIS